MNKIFIIILTMFLTTSIFATEIMKPKNCTATQSSQARVEGKSIDKSTTPDIYPLDLYKVKVITE